MGLVGNRVNVGSHTLPQSLHTMLKDRQKEIDEFIYKTCGVKTKKDLTPKKYEELIKFLASYFKDETSKKALIVTLDSLKG